VRKGARNRVRRSAETPEVFRSRALSLRAFDVKAMIVAADLVDGKDPGPALERLLADPAAAYVHSIARTSDVTRPARITPERSLSARPGALIQSHAASLAEDEINQRDPGAYTQRLHFVNHFAANIVSIR
jgi:hypothetical protein